MGVKMGSISKDLAQSAIRRNLKRKEAQLAETLPNLEDLVNFIIRDCADPARVLELYYWSSQPQFIEAARALTNTSKATRQMLETFLTMGKPEMIDADVDANGQLRLYSRDVQMVMEKIREAGLKSVERNTEIASAV
jgi:hypothetical protein